MEPKAGDLLFYSGESPEDLAVRVGTASTWDHVAIAISDVAMLEALPGGVRVSPIRHPALLVDGFGWNSACERVQQASIGKPYGWMNDLSAALGGRVLLHGEIECAQLAGAILRAQKQKPPGVATPQAVFWSVGMAGRSMQFIV